MTDTKPNERQCCICLGTMAPFAEAKVLHRYTVSYFRCESCGFVQTEPPYWLDEAYGEAIARSDVGLVSRNQRLAIHTRALIAAFFDPAGRFLDYAGGYGLFTRMMRDAGLDFYHWDSYCPNLFAQQFKGDPTKARGCYELVTAFEVLEHLLDPVQEVERLLQMTDSLLFTTLLLPSHVPKPGTWWFYGLEHGQHVSIYSSVTLARMADRLGVSLLSDGAWLHLFTRKKLSRPLFGLVSRYKVALLVAATGRRKSLIPADYESVTGSKLE